MIKFWILAFALSMDALQFQQVLNKNKQDINNKALKAGFFFYFSKSRFFPVGISFKKYIQ